MSKFYVRDRREGKFFILDNPIVDHFLPKIGVYGLATYCVLCRHSRLGSTFVGLQTIATAVRCSTKTIQRSIDDLIGVGLLQLVSGKMAGHPNTYNLLTPPELAPESTPEPVEPDEDAAKTEGRTMATEGRTLTPTDDATVQGGRTMASGGLDNDAFLYRKNKTINKTNKTTTAEATATASELPEWIDPDAWAGYLEMRRTVPGKKATPRALELVLGKLKQFNAAGHDTTAILNQSVVACWTDVYALKQPQGGRNGYSNGNDVAPRTQRNRNAVAEVIADIERQDRGGF